MDINWNIHGFPEDEQKEIVKKAMCDYCDIVFFLEYESIFHSNCVHEAVDIYRTMIRFFNNETLSDNEIIKCKKYFVFYKKQTEFVWHLRNYYPEIEALKEICEKCLQWIDEYE